MKIANTVMVPAITIPAAVSEPASASCDRNQRISHRDAECLAAEWHNPSGIDVLVEWRWYKVRD